MIFVYWQGYPPTLRWVILLLASGMALEALSNTFFVALQVQGRQALQSKINGLAAISGFAYGFTALALEQRPWQWPPSNSSRPW